MTTNKLSLSKYLKEREPIRLYIVASLLLLVVYAIVAALFHHYSRDLKLSAPFRMDSVHRVKSSEDMFAIDSGSSFQVLGYPVNVDAHTYYSVCLPIDSASEATHVVVDLAGTGYDSPAQEADFLVKNSTIRTRYCFSFNTDEPPADTGLRVMHTGGAKLQFQRPTISRLPFDPKLMHVINISAFAIGGLLIAVLALPRKSNLPRLIYYTRDRVGWAALSDCLVLSAILISVLYAGITAFASPYPWVFIDEYSYAWLSAHNGDLSLAEHVGIVSTLAHSFAYFKAYSLAFLAGDSSFTLAKLLNVTLWLASAALSYIAALKLLNRRIAASFALIVSISPWIVYTRSFMPETMYVCGFWLAIVALIWGWNSKSVRGELLLGVVLGGLALVKSHAVLLLPGFTIGISAALLIEKMPIRAYVINVLFRCMALFGSFFAAKSVGAFILTGRASSSAFGGYAGEFTQIHKLLEQPGQTGLQVASVFVRHLGISMIAAGLAIFVTVVYLVTVSKRAKDCQLGRSDTTCVLLCTSAIGLVLSLVLVTSVFTVLVSGSGPYESIARTHTRYYGFLLPLVVLAGLAASVRMYSMQITIRKAAMLASPLALLSLGWLLMHSSGLYANDGPDALPLVLRSMGVVLNLVCVSSIAWLTSKSFRQGVKLILCLTLIYYVSASYVYWHIYYMPTSVAQAEDIAGEQFRLLVPQAKRDEGVIIAADNSVQLERLLFYVNSSAPVLLRPSGKVSIDELSGKRWLMSFAVAPTTVDSQRAIKLGENVTLYVLDDKSIQ